MVTLSVVLLAVVNYAITWVANKLNLPDIPLPSGTILKSGVYISAIVAGIMGLVVVMFKARFPELYTNIEATITAAFVGAQALYAILNAFQPKGS